MKIRKILCLILCISLMLSMCGCSFPDLFYKTPSLEDVKKEEIQTKVTMPDLSGLTYEQAVEKTENIPLIASKQYNEKVKKDKIAWQSIKAGEEISIGTPVNIVISKGIQKIEVPKVSDMDYLAAKTVLESLGFKVKISYQHKWGTETGEILKISPSEGRKINKGSTIKLTVDAVNPKDKNEDE